MSVSCLSPRAPRCQLVKIRPPRCCCLWTEMKHTLTCSCCGSMRRRGGMRCWWRRRGGVGPIDWLTFGSWRGWGASEEERSRWGVVREGREEKLCQPNKATVSRTMPAPPRLIDGRLVRYAVDQEGRSCRLGSWAAPWSPAPDSSHRRCFLMPIIYMFSVTPQGRPLVTGPAVTWPSWIRKYL